MAILTFGFMQTEIEVMTLLRVHNLHFIPSQLGDDEYTTPDMPIPLPTFTDLIPFGAAMKKAMFLTDVCANCKPHPEHML